MRLDKSLSLGLLVLLILSVVPFASCADISENSYFYRATWLEQTTRLDGDAGFESIIAGDCRLTIDNLSQVGSEDVYFYTFDGFVWNNIPVSESIEDSVSFQDNKVHFDLSVDDSDNNNYTENAVLSFFPSYSRHHPGHIFFVNPVWATHSTGWNESLDAARIVANNTLVEISSSHDQGYFSLHILLNFEHTHEEYGFFQGTIAFDYVAQYDQDGILERTSLLETTTLENTNHSLVETSLIAFERTQGPSFGFGSTTTVPLMAVVSLCVGTLLCGIVLGRLYWG